MTGDSTSGQPLLEKSEDDNGPSLEALIRPKRPSAPRRTYTPTTIALAASREITTLSKILMGYSALATVLLLYLIGTPSILSPAQTADSQIDLQPTGSVPQMLNQLPWKPTLLGDTDIDPDFNRALYKEDFGKKLLVLDVDTRPWKSEDPQNMSQLAWGRVNHIVYAEMHGYDYKFVTAAEPASGASWAKLSPIHQALEAGVHDFVVFTDADVVFPHLKIPLEHLFERWGITPEVSLSMARSQPYDLPDKDETLSSGLMIVRNDARARAMLADWIACPSDPAQFPGCANAVSRREAFKDYIRPKYPNATAELPCDEANGSDYGSQPASVHGGARSGAGQCRGSLVGQYSNSTDEIARGVRKAIADLVLPVVIDEVMGQWATAD